MAVVAIIGRPNVGKSTLFNRLVGQRQALVDDRPGVTRDRNYGEGNFLGRRYHFIDTGGFEPIPDDELFKLYFLHFIPMLVYLILGSEVHHLAAPRCAMWRVWQMSGRLRLRLRPHTVHKARCCT